MSTAMTEMTSAMDNLLNGLTEPQRQAVEHIDGPVLVLAGPGSGKTTVVTRRVANLIANGIPAWQILALTFTNKAAGEMRERIEALLPENLPGRRGLTVATFHSFCARLLRRYATEAGLDENYTIYDAGDQRETIKQAMKIVGLDSKNWTPASVGATISNAKNQLLDAKDYAARAGDFYTRSIAKIYQQYERALRENRAVDFDDLLLITAKMLRDNHRVRAELQERYQYLLIDEYQDTNHAQFIIAHSLASAHRNICVVGDPDQSIYGWRGADIRNIMEFEEHYPNAAVIPLGQNFRSTKHIVAVADHLIRHNTQRKDKKLHTELDEGEKPLVITCEDEHKEAQLIIDHMKRLHTGEGNLPGVAWKEMAVLYRINALSRVLEEHFRDAQIPYLIARGTAFYDRKEIRDAQAYLRIVANPNAEVALRRIINTPTRGIGKTTLEKIEIFAIRNQIGLFDALKRIGEVSDLSTRAVNAVGKFVSMVEGWRAMDESGGLLNKERTPLAELVERVIRESGMEEHYRKATSEEERERLDNLEELINAAGEFAPQTAPGLLGTAPGIDDAAVQSVDDETADGADHSGDDADAREDASGERAGDVETIADGAAAASAPSLLQTLTAYLESVALVSDADAIDPAMGAVTLMTLHAAKGLEFDVIALAGLEEGLLPHSRSLDSPSEMEEERRLCFVGITRARKHLLITRAAARAQRGYRERTIPSQFLRELPEDSIVTLDMAGGREWDDEKDDGWGRERKSGRRSEGVDDEFVDDVPTVEYGSWSPGGKGASRGRAGAALPVGCMVRHAKFGVGRVEGITPRPAGTSVRVNFRGVGVKTLVLEYAKLERLG
jgi:DNA helicase II / ATP-dependent DNA helicase PcrA